MPIKDNSLINKVIIYHGHADSSGFNYNRHL